VYGGTDLSLKVLSGNKTISSHAQQG